VIKSIASVRGVCYALELERPFRSGGTIKGLEEIELLLKDPEKSTLEYRTWCLDALRSDETIERLALENPSRSEACLIGGALADVPGILFLDSRIPENAYCDGSKKISGSNLDDIRRIVRQLPYHIGGMVGDFPCEEGAQNDLDCTRGLKAMLQAITSKEPSVIVMHLNAFQGLPETAFFEQCKAFSSEVSRETCRSRVFFKRASKRL